MGTHYNRLAEAILMSTHNIGFYEELTKIIHQLSSATLLMFFWVTYIFSSNGRDQSFISFFSLVDILQLQ